MMNTTRSLVVAMIAVLVPIAQQGWGADTSADGLALATSNSVARFLVTGDLPPLPAAAPAQQEMEQGVKPLLTRGSTAQAPGLLATDGPLKNNLLMGFPKRRTSAAFIMRNAKSAYGPEHICEVHGAAPLVGWSPPETTDQHLQEAIARERRLPEPSPYWQPNPRDTLGHGPQSQPYLGLEGGYDYSAIDMVHEMYRLFHISADDDTPDAGPLLVKSLLALPLLGRGNGLFLLLRPQTDIYNTYVDRVALRPFNQTGRIERPANTIAVDTHVHTCYSWDSFADVSQVLLAAERRGLAGVAITDHNTIEGAQKAMDLVCRLKLDHKLPDAFFVIPGEEVSSLEGHIIGLFLTREVPAGMSAGATVQAIHAQGGLAIATHPLLPGDLGELARTLPFDAVESRNGFEEIYYALARSRVRTQHLEFYAAITKPHLGASDAHDPDMVGCCYTLMKCAPTPEAVREALLAGRCTPVTGMSDDQVEALARHPLLRAVAAIRSAKGRPGRWLSRVVRADQATFSIWPRPCIQILKRF